MICTCEKCKSAFFTDNPPLFCPDCGEQLHAFAGLDELKTLAVLLSSGRIKESREFYEDKDADRVPPLMDVVERMDTLLDQIPEKIWRKYRRDYYDVKNFLTNYRNGYYYENLKKRGVPKIETSGLKLWLSLRSFLEKVEKNAPSEEPEETEVEVSEEEVQETAARLHMDPDQARAMLKFAKR